MILRIEVVDATRDRAASGMRVDVFALGARARKLCTGVVDAHGTVDAPVLATSEIVPGEYEAVFHIGEYFERSAAARDGSPALDTIPFRFAIQGPKPYVLPVRIAPWAFSLARDGRSPSASTPTASGSRPR